MSEPAPTSSPSKSPYALEVRNLSRSFGSRKILEDISFQLKHGEILIIMGGSGCGKSTLLRHIIGSLKPDSGEIYIHGTEITKLDDEGMSKIRKRFGMLFQSGALFNSMTVGENVALPILESSDVAPNIAELVVRLKLELVGLTGFEHLKPAQISGGMKKRVGMARALALDPDLLFCDEPTAGLDPVMTSVIDTLTVDLTQEAWPHRRRRHPRHDQRLPHRHQDDLPLRRKGSRPRHPGRNQEQSGPGPPAIHQRLPRRPHPAQALQGRLPQESPSGRHALSPMSPGARAGSARVRYPPHFSTAGVIIQTHHMAMRDARADFVPKTSEAAFAL